MYEFKFGDEMYSRYYLCCHNIMFWLTMMKHDEEYCKHLVNAAMSEYAAAYPLC